MGLPCHAMPCRTGYRAGTYPRQLPGNHETSVTSLVHNPSMGAESAADRNIIGAAISQLRPTCEQSLFAGLDRGDSNLILLDMKNQIRVNLELIEALAVLLSEGLHCSYAALVLARSSFEHSITTAWVLSSRNPQQRTSRFASLLADEIKQQTRNGAIHIDEESGPAYSLLEFLKEVSPDIFPIKDLPTMRERLKAIDAEPSYLLYALTSQVIHGSRAAYQARYGWDKNTVKIDRSDEWQGALGIALEALEQAVSQFAFSATVDSLVREQLLPDSDDECVKLFDEAFERRSAPVFSLLDEAMSCL